MLWEILCVTRKDDNLDSFLTDPSDHCLALSMQVNHCTDVVET